MSFLDFEANAPIVNVLIFLVSAGFVWRAGKRISEYLDAIAEKTKLGHGFIGVLFLGGITSLPELATIVTASYSGNAPLAINNSLGSAGINLVLLAFADALIGRDALTSVIAQASTLLQGILGVILLAIVSCAVLIKSGTFWGLSLWTWLLLPSFIFSMWLLSGYTKRATWVIRDERRRVPFDGGQHSRVQDIVKLRETLMAMSLRRLILLLSGVALIILIAGFLLAKTGDALSAQTGLGAGLMGLIFVSFATSLPEFSAIRSAIRLRQYEMAVGDIFGANLWNVAHIVVADAIYSGESVFSRTGRFELFATLLGIVLTCLYTVGLLERQDRTIFRVGYDSALVIVVYFSGLILLYFLGS